MNTRFFILLFFASAVFLTVPAQTRNVVFEYDASGNCIVKYKTVVLPARSMAYDFENQEDFSLTDDAFGEIKTIIFPNPTKGILQVEFQNKPDELSVNYRLVSMTGKHIATGTGTDSFLTLDLSAMPAGTYLLHLTMDGKSETYKIIKQ